MAGHQQNPTIIYPYKYVDSEELKYSLLSLKNVEHDKVYVIGDETPHADSIQFTKPLWAKYSNAHDQIAKYYHACTLDTEEELILMNDDIFCMAPWKPENYHRGELLDQVEQRGRLDYYTRQLRSTNSFLLSQGLTNLSFELHCPMIVEKSKLKQAIEELIPFIQNGKVVLLRSYYGNRFNVESKFMEDVKNPKDPRGMKMISTDTHTFNRSLGEYIKANL